MLKCHLLAIVLVSACPRVEAAPPITAAAFPPDGKSVVVGSQSGLTSHSWPQLEAQGTIKTELANVHDLAFSPRGDLLLAAGGKPAESGVIEIIRWPDGKRISTIAAGDDVVYSVGWQEDGSAFAAACGDRRVRVFSRDGELRRTLEGHSRAVLAVRFLDHKTVISAGRDQSLRLWDAETGASLRSLDNHTAAVNGLAVRPGATAGSPAWVASIGADRTLRLWRPTIGRLVRFAKLPSEPLAVEWTSDGSRVAAACADGHVRMIDPDTSAIVDDWPVLEGWAYTILRSPTDGSFLVAGQNGQMRRVQRR